jgi:hypothetical protein
VSIIEAADVLADLQADGGDVRADDEGSMSSPPGITTIEDIRQRCFVNEAGCWQWRYACNSQGTPQAWFPGRGITTSVTSIAHSISKGCEIPKGKLWRPFCAESHCVNPEHQRYTTRGRVMKGEKSAVHVMKITIARRGRSKLTPEAVEDIRSSTDTLHSAAARHGVTRSTISRIRLGRCWREIGPVSVFSHGMGIG